MGVKVLGWVALAFLACGLIAGFVPVSSGGVNCGSALVSSDDAAVEDLTSTLGGLGPVTDHAGTCDTLRSLVSVPTWVLLGVGGAAGLGWLIGGTVSAWSAPTPKTPETGEPAQTGSTK